MSHSGSGCVVQGLRHTTETIGGASRLRIVEHRVLSLTVVVAVVGGWLLWREHEVAVYGALCTAMVLTTAAVLLPARPVWPRTVSIVLVWAAVAFIQWHVPSAALPALELAVVAASFFAVRVHPRTGLWFFLSELAVCAWPLYRARATYDELTFIVTVGATLILALQIYEVAEKFRQYRRMSLYDDLTGLHNTRYFHYTLQRLCRDPHAGSLAVCLFDLDRFKTVNDLFGHRAGDDVLRRAAAVLQDTANPAVVSRYGGEEFAVILVGKSTEDIIQFAERMRLAMEQSQLCQVPVTLSCGIAHDGVLERSPEVLFDAADRALYTAKLRRNSVVVYDGSEDPGHLPASVEISQ